MSNSPQSQAGFYRAHVCPKLTLGVIARYWITALAARKISYDPARIAARFLPESGKPGHRFMVVYNPARKDRGGSGVS